MRGYILKRHVWMLLIFSCVIFLLIGRLAYIQLIGTESFSRHDIDLIKQAVSQRQQQVVLHNGRGEIIDRHGQPLTGKSTHVLVLYPLSKQSSIQAEKIAELAEHVQLSAEQFSEHIQTLTEPQVYRRGGEVVQFTEQQAEEINRLKIPGILGVPYELRYDEEQLLARHLLGFIGENAEWVKEQYAAEWRQGLIEENRPVGISGLERTFQSFLQGTTPTSLSYYVDGHGNRLQGMDVKYTAGDNPFYPLNIQTTLDMDLQKELERSMDERDIQEGTALVLDVETSEILAMASRPQVIDPGRVSQAWENKALQRYTPGSIFKIVTAAAALEEGLVEFGQPFECAGVLEGTSFHCWKHEGHGELNFEQAFAESCNIVFGQLAQQLGAEQLTEYARKLGLLDHAGWETERLYNMGPFRQLHAEQVGQVFAEERIEQEREDKLYLMQSGIGQLDVQVTPLAVANMLATIAKGGVKHQVKAVQEIVYQTGGSFHRFPAQDLSGPTISPYTAYQLQRLLEGVIENGTAQRLKEKPWQAAGKTGTAEVPGTASANKRKANHHWFAGYYPRQNPQYVVVGLNLNQGVGTGNRSVDVFADVVDWLENASDVIS